MPRSALLSRPRFPALAHFARDIRPLGVERREAFEEILAAQLAHIEAAV